MPEPPAYLSVSSLKARGWTDALIRTLLAEPDLLRPNPHYRSRAPMRLYAQARVEAVEQSDAWRQTAAARAQRQASAARAVQTKQQRLEAYVEALEMAVPLVPEDTLMERACQHYNRLQDERGRWESAPATPASDPAFLQRIAVNFLRHRLSRYEVELARVFGKVGVRQAYSAINAKVYAAIAAAYPTLAGECARQLRAKEMRAKETHDA